MQRATVTLRTGALGVFCGITYDPVARVVVVQPNPAEMRPGLQYVLRVEPGLLGWDGSALAAPFTLRFVAGPRVSPPPPEPVPSLARDIAPRLAERCGDARCHGGVAPVMGLDLSSAAAIRTTTLRVLARQRPEGPWVQSAPRWGALPRIDPGVAEGQGRPAMSYLLYENSRRRTHRRRADATGGRRAHGRRDHADCAMDRRGRTGQLSRSGCVLDTPAWRIVVPPA